MTRTARRLLHGFEPCAGILKQTLNVADRVLCGVPLIITPQLARAAIRCIEGCEIASRENRTLHVEFTF